MPVVLLDSPVLYAYLMYIHTKSLANSGVESTVKEDESCEGFEMLDQEDNSKLHQV